VRSHTQKIAISQCKRKSHGSYMLDKMLITDIKTLHASSAPMVNKRSLKTIYRLNNRRCALVL